jgi:hypothetical protein
VADVAHEPAAIADAAPCRRVAEAAAHGRRETARRRLDPAREPGNDDRLKSAHRGSIPQVRARLDALKREVDRIQAIDYLDSPAGQRARASWEALAKRLRAVEAKPRTGGRTPRTSVPPAGSTWVTRPRPHIDRIASAWLIKRFCDCTFETLVKRFAIKDRRVRLIAEIVHEADLHDGTFTRQESTGVDLAIKGMAATTQDDHELLERGMALFDGLYTVLKQKS